MLKWHAVVLLAKDANVCVKVPQNVMQMCACEIASEVFRSDWKLEKNNSQWMGTLKELVMSESSSWTMTCWYKTIGWVWDLSLKSKVE